MKFILPNIVSCYCMDASNTC